MNETPFATELESAVIEELAMKFKSKKKFITGDVQGLQTLRNLNRYAPYSRASAGKTLSSLAGKRSEKGYVLVRHKTKSKTPVKHWIETT